MHCMARRLSQNQYYSIDDVPGATVDALYQYLLYGGEGDCDSCGHVWDGRGKPPFACTDDSPDHSQTYTIIVTSYDKDRAIGPALQAIDNQVDWIATAQVRPLSSQLTTKTVGQADSNVIRTP